MHAKRVRHILTEKERVSRNIETFFAAQKAKYDARVEKRIASFFEGKDDPPAGVLLCHW